MRIKLDENLPESLLASLGSLGHDVDNVRMEELSGRPDPDVWQAAQARKRYLITQDMDFSNMKKFAPGTHHGLLVAPAARARADRAGPSSGGGLPIRRRGIMGTMFCFGYRMENSRPPPKKIIPRSQSSWFMNWRSRRWRWPRRALTLCRPRHSLPAVVGRVSVATATGHVRRCAICLRRLRER